MNYKINFLALRDQNTQSTQFGNHIRREEVIALGSKHNRKKSGRSSYQQKIIERSSFLGPNTKQPMINEAKQEINEIRASRSKLSLLSVEDERKQKIGENKTQQGYEKIQLDERLLKIVTLQKAIFERDERIRHLEEKDKQYRQELMYIKNNLQNINKGYKIENEILKHHLTQKNAIISQLMLQKDSLDRKNLIRDSDLKETEVKTKISCLNCQQLTKDLNTLKKSIDQKNEQIGKLTVKISLLSDDHQTINNDLNHLKSHYMNNYEQEIQTLEDVIRKLEAKLQKVIEQYSNLMKSQRNK